MSTPTSAAAAVPAVPAKPKLPCPHCPSTFGRTNDRDDHILRLHPNAERFPCGQCLRSFATADSRARHQKSAKCKLAVPVPLPKAATAPVDVAPVLPGLRPFTSPTEHVDGQVAVGQFYAETTPHGVIDSAAGGLPSSERQQEEKEAIDPPNVPTVKVEVRTTVLDKVTLCTSTNGFAEWLQHRPLQAGESRPGETTRKQYVESLRAIMTVAERLVQNRKIGDIFASGFDFRQLVMHEQITVVIIDKLRCGQGGSHAVLVRCTNMALFSSTSSAW